MQNSIGHNLNSIEVIVNKHENIIIKVQSKIERKITQALAKLNSSQSQFDEMILQKVEK